MDWLLKPMQGCKKVDNWRGWYSYIHIHRLLFNCAEHKYMNKLNYRPLYALVKNASTKSSFKTVPSDFVLFLWRCFLNENAHSFFRGKIKKMFSFRHKRAKTGLQKSPMKVTKVPYRLQKCPIRVTKVPYLGYKSANSHT
jgi:hypothetical protein